MKNMTRKVKWVAAVVGFAGSMTCAAAPAWADLPDEKVWIEGGFSSARADTSVQVSSKTSDTVGAKISLEKDLGYKRTKGLPLATAGVRVGKRFVVGFDYYRLHRSANNQLDRDFVFDDVTYPVDADVTSTFDSDIYRGTIGYIVHDGKKSRLAVALGAHVTTLAVGIEGRGTLDGVTFQSQVRERKVTAPLPTIGINGEVEVAPRVILAGRADYLSLKVGDYKGSLANLQASARYAVSKNISVGVLYRFVDYKLKIDKPDYRGRVQYKFYGPGAFLRVGF
jgi:hypothetical protein